MLRRFRRAARFCALLSLPVAFVLPAGFAPASGETASSGVNVLDSATKAGILRRIQIRGRRVHDDFAGIAARRRSVVRVYDGTTNALKNTIRLTADRVDYYDRKAEVTVLSYNKDGRELPPSEFGYHEFEPPLPLFDEHAEHNYRFRLLEPVAIEGTPCYRLQVIPRANTLRHFRGDLYFAVDSLELKYLKGSYARLQIGLKSFWFEFYFREHRLGAPVFTRGRAEGRIYFPLIRDEFIESDLIISDQKPIRRGPRPRIEKG